MIKRAVYSFEDLEVYKLAREFSNKVSQLMKKLPKEEEYDLVTSLLNYSTSYLKQRSELLEKI